MMLGRLTSVLGGATLVLLAQSPVPELKDAAERAEIQARLSSSAPEQSAWGAYLAAENGERSFVPSIIPLLRHEHPYVQLAAVDALMRLKADVPPETLKGLRIDDSLDPVLALISIDPKRHSAVLIDLFDQGLNDEQWVAVNSMLWEHPTREYATRLLREWRLRMAIEVEDGVRGIGCGGQGYGGSGKPVRDRSGFPPIWHYAVYEGVLMPGATAIADGPHPASFVRQKEARTGGGKVPRDDYRKDYLQGLAHIGLPNSWATFRWTNAAKYRADAADLILLVQKCEAELRRSLLAQGLLDRSELPLGQEPEFVVVDRRDDQTIPLPTIRWRIDGAFTDRQ
jgi:hypothetical protein